MRPYPLVLFTSLVLLFTQFNSFQAAAKATGIEQITAPEVKQMLDEGRGTVINVLSDLEYDMQHIPGSINIPVVEMASTNKLPQDTGAPLVFYGMGRGWAYSERAARIAIKRGYGNVYVFAGGIPKWRQFTYPMAIDRDWQIIRTKKLSPSDFKTVLKEKKPYILDVGPMNLRGMDFSFLPDSHSCPLVFMKYCCDKLPRDRALVIVDQAMKQSPVAAKFLTTKGYRVLGILKGGIDRWKIEGFEVRNKAHSIAPRSAS